MKAKLLTAAIALFAGAQAGSAATVYTDLSAFLSGSPDAFLETFSDEVSAPISVTSSTGGHVAGGKWQDVINGQIGTTVWTFASPLGSFGANFDLSPKGFGSGITVTLGLVGGGSLEVGTIANLAGSFWGVVSDEAFTTVTFSESMPVEFETYTLDNLIVAPPIAPVPLPATAGLTMLALGGLFALRRRRG